MDTQLFLNWILGAISAVLGWFSRELWSAVKELKTDLAKLREELPKEYLMKDDFLQFKSELFGALTRIESKLDGKQDK